MASLNSAVGALLIGDLFAVYLAGLATVQAWYYYETLPTHEPIITKLVVSFVWLLQMAHTLCTSYTAYRFSTPRNGQLAIGTDITFNLTWNVSCFLVACIAVVVQAYYARRFQKLSKQLVLPVLYWLSSAALLAFASVIMAKSVDKNYSATFATVGHMMDIALCLAAGIDIVLCISLCSFLMVMRKDSSRSTMRVLDHIMAWTIETGLITSVCTIVTAILWKTVYSEFTWMMFYTPLAGLYVNSLLALLNSRSRLHVRPGSEPHQPLDIAFHRPGNGLQLKFRSRSSVEFLANSEQP